MYPWSWNWDFWGKSRLLEEFPRWGDFTDDLHKRIKDAYVFKVLYENGTRYSAGVTELGCIFSCMMLNGNFSVKVTEQCAEKAAITK